MILFPGELIRAQEMLWGGTALEPRAGGDRLMQSPLSVARSATPKFVLHVAVLCKRYIQGRHKAAERARTPRLSAWPGRCQLDRAMPPSRRARRWKGRLGQGSKPGVRDMSGRLGQGIAALYWRGGSPPHGLACTSAIPLFSLSRTIRFSEDRADCRWLSDHVLRRIAPVHGHIQRGAA